MVNQLPIHDVALDNEFNILGAHLDIGRIVGHNPDNRPLGAKAKTARGHNIDPASQVVFRNQMDKPIDDAQTAGIVARRAAATQHLDMV